MYNFLLNVGWLKFNTTYFDAGDHLTDIWIQGSQVQIWPRSMDILDRKIKSTASIGWGSNAIGSI